jgi:hypothetical protein
MWKKLAINGVIILWAIAAGVFLSVKPWQVYQKQNQEAKQRIHEMQDAESRRDQLLSKEGRAASSIGREEQARKAGYLGPNEVASDADKK